MNGSTVVIKYDGTDITSHVLFADAEFTSQMGALPGTFEFRCKDPNQSLSFVTGKRITVDIDGVRVYGGFLMQVGRGYAFPADKLPSAFSDFRNRIWTLRGVDFNTLFDRRVLRNTANYLRQIPTLTSVTDGAVIRQAASTYLDLPGDLDHTTFVDDIHTFSKYAWKQQGTKWRETMDELARYTGALIYLDGNLALHHHEIDTTVKRWGFSDKPNRTAITASPASYQGATYGPREVTGIEDGSFFVNDDFIWGGSEWAGSGGTVFARAQNAGSISDHGRWQYAETHFGELGFGVQSGVDARADLIVNGSPGAVGDDQQRGLRYAQWQFRLAWFAHGVPLLSGNPNHIVPGELVTFSLYVYSEDAGVTPLIRLLPLRSVRMTFPNLDRTGKGFVRFDGFFGLQPDDPFALWKFLLGVQSKIITTGASVVDNSSTAAAYGSLGEFTPSPSPDGATTIFTVPFGYIAGTTILYLNGLSQRLGVDYSESNPETGEITMTSAPVSTDNLFLTCKVFG